MKIKSILVATKNKGKLKEIRAIMDNACEIIGLEDWDNKIEIVEDADSFEGNALKKAATCFEKTQIPCLADDSGLEVDALGGRPGIHSARYGGTMLKDEDRCKLLLTELLQVPIERRTARFVAVLAFCEAQEKTVFFRGELEGVITLDPRGKDGFGYDPIFVPNGYNLTVAELDAAVKNTISHRAQALSAFKSYMRLIACH